MIFFGCVIFAPFIALAKTYADDLFENHSMEEARKISARKAIWSIVWLLVLTPILRLLARSPYSTMGLSGEAGDMMSQAMEAAEPMMAIMLLGFSALNVCLLICLDSNGKKEEADGEKEQAE